MTLTIPTAKAVSLGAGFSKVPIDPWPKSCRTDEGAAVHSLVEASGVLAGLS